MNPARKWTYKTSPIVTHLFEQIAACFDDLKNLPKDWCTDVLPAVVKFYFDDKRVDAIETYDLESSGAFIQTARLLVPKTEYMPVCIITSDDYEEDEK